MRNLTLLHRLYDVEEERFGNTSSNEKLDAFLIGSLSVETTFHVWLTHLRTIWNMAHPGEPFPEEILRKGEGA